LKSEFGRKGDKWGGVKTRESQTDGKTVGFPRRKKNEPGEMRRNLDWGGGEERAGDAAMENCKTDRKRDGEKHVGGSLDGKRGPLLGPRRSFTNSHGVGGKPREQKDIQ